MLGNQPSAQQIFLDHIGHWLPAKDAAKAALEALGFTITPFSEQRQNDADGNLIPAGSGNYCVMLEQGYLEFLIALADTPIGRELNSGISRYVGVHIAAFACADATHQHAYMQKLGFNQRPLAKLSREVLDREDISATARFDVARPQTGTIAEGRVQFLTHHTPELIWQPRYVEHANGALALSGLSFAVTNLDEAVQRYSRILQQAGEPLHGAHVFSLDQGALTLFDYSRACELFADAPLPQAPSMISYQLQCRSLKTFIQQVENSAAVTLFGQHAIRVDLPSALGSTLLVTEQAVPSVELLHSMQ